MKTALLKELYRKVLTIRRFEQSAIGQYRIGNIYGYLHPYMGEEAIAVGAISALNLDDYIVSTHRGHGHAIAKGHDLGLMMAELFGKSTGYCRGRGGSMHVASLKQYNLGANGIVGGGIPIATGAGMAIKQKGTNQVVLSFFSDGAANNGVFHESLNLAAIYHLPVIYILENNQYAATTPVENVNLVEDLSIRAAGYGIPGITIDGNDAVQIYETIQKPITRARAGEGPTLIECKTYRHSGHHVNDPGAYMPKETMAYWKAKDPVDILRKYLVSAGVEESEIAEINQRVEKKLEAAVQFAKESPEPSAEEFLAEIPVY
ncbi:MAG: thiamine pyrophosphate-dependent dehydrogenase E1 component subunit alpha [Anaerolineaceae bacterium]|nr:thiamine pyrophosphate-dependent dehydrogenase E1 component subunit alpha [Anaerolineaceae bacterium]